MKTIIYTLTILTTFLLSNEIKACDCIDERTVKEEIKNSDVVVVGEIIGSKEIVVDDTLSSNKILSIGEMRYTIIIETVYKGKQISDTTFIFTGRGAGDCGYRFQIGQKYIVYGNFLKDKYNRQAYIGNKSAFDTSGCKRTQKYQSDEIAEIKKYLKRKRNTDY